MRSTRIYLLWQRYAASVGGDWNWPPLLQGTESEWCRCKRGMVSGRTGTIFQSDYLHIIPVEQAAQIKRTGKHTITLPNVTAHEHFAMHERGLSNPMETPPVPGPDQRGPSYSHFRQHVHQAHLLPSAASHRSVRKAKHILDTAEMVVFLHHTRVVKYFEPLGCWISDTLGAI